MKAAFPMWNIEPTELNIEMWHFELYIYTVADLRRAYSQIINSGGKSPPTLPEVKKACKGHHSDAMSRQPDDRSLPAPEKITDEKATENLARLKRIMGGVELDPGKGCHVGHLSQPMQRRFREIVAGIPTYGGFLIDPSYIPNEGKRVAYEAEIEAWRTENPGV